MTVALRIVSPLPPIPSGIADYVAEQLPVFGRLLPGTIGESDRETSIAVPPGIELRTRSAVTDADTVPIYHFGNNIHHEFVIERAREKPGIAVAHELVFHHLFTELTLARGDFQAYRDMLEEELGLQGLRIAYNRYHGFFTQLEEFLIPLNRRLLEPAQGVIVHSEWAAGRVRSLFPGKPVRTIPHHFEGQEKYPDKADARRELGVGDEIVIACLGFVTPPKKVDLVLKALGRLRPELNDFAVIIAGEDKSDGVIPTILRDQGLQDRVKILGYVSDAGFRTVVSAADIVVNLRYPTAGETSGTLTKSMGMGKATIVYNYASFSDLPKDASVKIALDTRDTKELDEAIRRLVNNREYRAAVGHAAEEYIERTASIDQCVHQYIEFANELV